MIEVNKQGEVWIFAEQEDSHISDVPLELLSKGRELADTLGVKLGAMLLGNDVEAIPPPHQFPQARAPHGAGSPCEEDCFLTHTQ